MILDASFRSREERAALNEWCQTLGTRLVFVECVAPHEVLRDRLRQRAHGPSISDGREELFDAFLARYDPPNEFAANARCTLDTTLSDAEQLGVLRALLSNLSA